MVYFPDTFIFYPEQMNSEVLNFTTFFQILVC